MRPWQPRSVRVRLTLWHLGALLGVLALYAGGVFLFVQRNLVADLDRQLQEDSDRAELSFTWNPDGTLSPHFASRMSDDPADEPEPGPWTMVWALDGRLLYQDRTAPGAVRTPPPVSARTSERTDSVALPGGGWVRQLTGPQDVAGPEVIVRVARPEDRVRRELRGLLIVLLVGVPVAAVVAGLGGYLVARRGLAPIDRMAASARSITAARLSDRLPVENPEDELGHLASVFNETFGRLELSFEQLRRFTADASHEMRTPLTALRTVGEVGLRETRSGEAYREIIGSMLEEADRLTQLVESLLTLARAEDGHVRLSRDRVDLGELAREVADHLGALAEDKQQATVVEASAPVLVDGDRIILRQAIINLLDNAIKYSPAGGGIRLVAISRSGEAILEVRDSGPGIAPEHIARIFERFYRVDKGRSRDAGGVGLGLSIAQWAVDVHGGHIQVESPKTGGSVFRIVLPEAH
jgi:heavy metal sensor kinase